MGSFVINTTEEEDRKLDLYVIKHGLKGKVDAIKELIAQINLEIKAGK